MIEVRTLRVAAGRLINYNYLAIDPATRHAVMVDPAWEFETLVHATAQAGARLMAVLLTHHHPDHVHLAQEVAQHYGVPILMGQQEADDYRFSRPRLEVFGPDTVLQIGSLRVRTVHTPGHTSGSTCYLIGEHCFSGDTLFNEGCGLCSGAGGDAAQMFHSLQKIKAMLAPDTRIHPGHCFGMPLGQRLAEVLRANIYLHFGNVDDFVRFRTRPNQQRARLLDFR